MVHVLMGSGLYSEVAVILRWSQSHCILLGNREVRFWVYFQNHALVMQGVATRKYVAKNRLANRYLVRNTLHH